MSVIVMDNGFSDDTWTGGFAGPEAQAANCQGVDLGPDAALDTLRNRLDKIAMIRVAFPSFADGRGFTIARRLRLMGYRGRLRAKGHMIADQYAMARRSGFDEVEISDDLATRQPQDQWLARADWRTHDYQSRLRGHAQGFPTPIPRLRHPKGKLSGLRDMMTVEMNIENQPARPVAVLPDAQTVTEVQHYTDRLFRFRVSRPRSLRFRPGTFVMIGLMGDNGRPLLRAYSIASPSWDEELEFYSIKVPDGPLTSKLQHIKVGDRVILRPKPVGTLVHDALLPGKRIWFFATGTGIAPFASLLRAPETYENFDQVILTHTCRDVAELKYGADLVENIRSDEMLAELIGKGFADKMVYYPTTTREQNSRTGRITDKLRDGSLFADLDIPTMNADHDRAMVCGSMGLNTDMKDILEGFGLREGANSGPAGYVVEKSFVGDGI